MCTDALAEPLLSFPGLLCWSSLPQKLYYPSFNTTVTPCTSHQQASLLCFTAPNSPPGSPAHCCLLTHCPALSSHHTLKPYTHKAPMSVLTAYVALPERPWWLNPRFCPLCLTVASGCAEPWADEPLQSPPGSTPAPVPGGERSAGWEEPNPEADSVYASLSQRPVFTVWNSHGKRFLLWHEALMVPAILFPLPRAISLQ